MIVPQEWIIIIIIIIVVVFTLLFVLIIMIRAVDSISKLYLDMGGTS